MRQAQWQCLVCLVAGLISGAAEAIVYARSSISASYLNISKFQAAGPTSCFTGSGDPLEFTGTATASVTGGGGSAIIEIECPVAGGRTTVLGPIGTCGADYLLELDTVCNDDVTPPATGTVNDGPAADIDAQLDTTTLSANWYGFGDLQSGISQYEWAIGTSIGGQELQPFTSVGLATSASRSGLSLSNGTTYYITVRATNGFAGTSTATSNGVTVTNQSTRLAFITPQRTFTAGVCGAAGSVLQVQLQDGVGTPLAAAADLNVIAASTSVAGAFFTDASCLSPAVANTFVIPTGSSTANLYYQDTIAGAPEISLANGGGHINPAPQAQTVLGASPTQLAFASPPRNFTVGACSGAGSFVRVQLGDLYANPTAAPVGGVDISVTSDSVGSVGWFTDSTCSSPAAGGFFTIPQGASFVDVYYSDSAVGTPTFSVANTAALTNPAPQQHVVSAGMPSQLVFTSPERTVVAGACSGLAGEVRLELRDSLGNPTVAGFGGEPITVSSDSTGTVSWYSDSSCATPAAGGAYTVPEGMSVVDVFFVDTAAGSPALSVTSGTGLTPPSPQVQTVVAGAPQRLSFTTVAPSTTAGQLAGPITVRLEDAYGNPVVAGAGGLSFTATSSSASATWYADAGGTLLAPGGVFTIPQGSSTVDMYYLDTLAGNPTVSLTNGFGLSNPATQSPTVSPGAAVSLAVSVPPGPVTAGELFSPPVTVTFLDAFGNVATSASSPVTILLVDPSATGAALSGTLTKTPTAGVAVFDDLFVDHSGSGFSLQVSASGFAPTQSPAFEVAPAAATQLRLVAAPVGSVATHPLSPAPTVEVLDALGNLANFSQPIAIELASGPGALSGTTSIIPTSGVAQFNDLRLSASGTYSLRATAPGLASSTSATFSVVPPVSATPDSYLTSSGGQVSLVASFGRPPYAWTVVSDVSGGALNGSVWTAGSQGHVEDALQVQDALGDTAFAYVAVANNAPTVGLQGTARLLPGTSGLLSASAQDPDGDTLSFGYLQLEGPAVSLSENGSSATFWVPSTATSGSLVFAVDVSDGQGATVRSLVSVAVVTAGSTPSITSSPALFARVGTPYSYDDDGLPAAVADGAVNWYGSISPPQASFAVSSVSGRVFWLPQAAGSYQLQLEARGLTGSTQQAFTVQVLGDSPPTLQRSANPVVAAGSPYVFDADQRLEADGTRPIRFERVEGPEDFFVDPSTGFVSWVPNSPGTHAITVRADNPEGADSYSFVVEVKPVAANAPSAIAEAQPQSGPAPLPVQFDGSRSVGSGSAEILSFRWDFGDGSPAVYSATPPLHHYLRAGGYLARLSLSDALGARAEVDVPIRVTNVELAPPEARIQWTEAAGGEDSRTVTLGCDCRPGTAPVEAYLWEYGDGDSSTLRKPTHTFRPAGRYRVRLVVVDANGLTAEDEVEVVVEGKDNQPPFARLSATPVMGPAPLPVRLVAEYGDPDGLVQKARLTMDGREISFAEASAVSLASVGQHEACIEVIDAKALWAKDCVSIDVQTSEGVSAPKIISQPSRRGQVGVAYLYDEDLAASAVGSRPYSWSLGTYVGDERVGVPDGMEVDATTGKLRWTPAVAGRHGVVLRVGNSAGSSAQAFEVVVSEASSQPPAADSGCGCGSAQAAGFLWALSLLALAIRRRAARS